MGRINQTTVFISHSHNDRFEALKLQKLFEENDAETFLDQKEIRAGDFLPDQIRNGIKICDKFLLIWSKHASKSIWVNKEWETAFEMKKLIIPYLLDNVNTVPLPDALYHFVYIDKTDQEHGHSELLRAIFGRIPDSVKGVTIYAGEWRAEIDLIDGSGTKIVYNLDLRPNGQVGGTIETLNTGMLGMVSQLVAMDGLDLGFMRQKFPIEGTWSYKPGTMYLNLVQDAYGQRHPINIQVHPTGNNENEMRGTGPGGTRFVFRRTNVSFDKYDDTGDDFIPNIID